MTDSIINIENSDTLCFLYYIIMVKFFSETRQHDKYAHRYKHTYDGIPKDFNKAIRFYVAMLPFIKYPNSFKEFNEKAEDILNKYYPNRNKENPKDNVLSILVELYKPDNCINKAVKEYVDECNKLRILLNESNLFPMSYNRDSIIEQFEELMKLALTSWN